MNALERLRAVLCAPDGEVVIDGTDADRSIVAEALKELDAALSQTAGVPEGYALVPMEPTEAMCGSIEYGAARHICETNVEDRRYFLRKAIAAAPAAPAASGGESKTDADLPGMWERADLIGGMTDAEPQPPAAASVSERARELLAAEYKRDGIYCNHFFDDDPLLDQNEQRAIRALEQALTQQREEAPCLYVKPRLVEILHKLGPAQTEHRVMVSTVPDAQYTVCLSTTPQPGAEALRELVQRWRGSGKAIAHICADQLESLLARGG